MSQFSRLEIHKLIAWPIILAGVAFLVFFSGALLWQKSSEKTQSVSEIESEMMSNVSYFAQEIYLGQRDAYLVRLANLQVALQGRIKSASTCVDLVVTGQEPQDLGKSLKTWAKPVFVQAGPC